MSDDTVRYIFFLMALLIIVSYFVGAATETSYLASGFQKIIFALTGRDSQGRPAAYPSGGGSVQAAA